MTSSDEVRIRLGQPGDLIETVPYLLGFHPEHSLVLIGLSSNESGLTASQRVQVALRIDLPPPGVVAEHLAPLVDALTRSDVGSVVAAAFVADVPGDPRADDRWLELGAVVTEALERDGLRRLDLLIATESAWWSLLCDDSACCPPGGTAREKGCSVAAAQATMAGLVALPKRQSLEDVLDGVDDSARRALDPAIEKAENRIIDAAITHQLARTLAADRLAVRSAARAASVAAHQPPVLTSRRLARLAVALCDLTVRDDVWLGIDEGSLDAAELMLQLLRRVPAPYDAAPLFLFGWHQWRDGNGTLASICAERALLSDPGYSAARLLLVAVQSGMNPRTTPSLREQAC